MTFPKIYSGKFCQKLFLVIWANYCWRRHFLAKVILVKLKILYILMQWLKWFFCFWNIFLYCKRIMTFLELSSTTFFMCILQTESTRRNTSITKKLKKMSTHDFHDDVIKWWQKWHISIFLSRLIPYCQYSICTKFQQMKLVALVLQPFFFSCFFSYSREILLIVCVIQIFYQTLFDNFSPEPYKSFALEKEHLI